MHTIETFELFVKTPEALFNLQKNMAGVHRTNKRLFELKNYNEKQFVAAVHMWFPDVCVLKLEEYWRGEFISEKLNEMAFAVYNTL